MSENVLNTLECVLSLSTKLHHTHEDLSSWLEKAEAHISSNVYQEPNGEQLTQAQNIQQVRLCTGNVNVNSFIRKSVKTSMWWSM